MAQIQVISQDKSFLFSSYDNGVINFTSDFLRNKMAELINAQALVVKDEETGISFTKIAENDLLVLDTSFPATKAITESLKANQYIAKASEVDILGLSFYVPEDTQFQRPITLNTLLRNLGFSNILPVNDLSKIFVGYVVITEQSGYFLGTVAMPQQPYVKLSLRNTIDLPSGAERELYFDYVEGVRGNWQGGPKFMQTTSVNGQPKYDNPAPTGNLVLPYAGSYLICFNWEPTNDNNDQQIQTMVSKVYLYQFLQYARNEASKGGNGGTHITCIINVSTPNQILRLTCQQDDYNGVHRGVRGGYQNVNYTWASIAYLG